MPHKINETLMHHLNFAIEPNINLLGKKKKLFTPIWVFLSKVSYVLLALRRQPV